VTTFAEFSLLQAKYFIFLSVFVDLSNVLRVILSRAPISQFFSSSGSIFAISALISLIVFSFSIEIQIGFKHNKAKGGKQNVPENDDKDGHIRLQRDPPLKKTPSGLNIRDGWS
jgi:hypothetical protein